MKVVLQHAGKWLHFDRPKRVLQANCLEDVLPVLQEAETSGLFAAGFISYEAAGGFDRALTTQSADDFPLVCLGLFGAPDVLEKIEEVPGAEFDVGTLEPSVSKPDFLAAIGSIKEQIVAGATYQVNYTYRLNGSFTGDAWAFFYELVNAQKTDYAAYIEHENWSICSASPELFFNASQGSIISRPMKGTARRGRTFAEDWKQAGALRQSEKDCAENIMIVDMIRNDIGRIATPGSIKVGPQFDVEKYPTCWQMTSTVQGGLPSAIEPSQIIKNLFPCASITGAPKAKTMEIIRELETTPRKIYTGSIGFITPQAETCFNVAIRTALIDRTAGTLEYGVGGGIVWDSDAEAEYEETLTKARILTQPRPSFQLLETMRWAPDGGIFLLNEHLQRLGKSAAYFDVPFEQYEIQAELDRVTESLDVPHRLRLLVSRDGSFELQLFVLSEDERGDLRVELAADPVDSQDVFLFHKTTHRGVYETALANSKCADVILWNERGEVTESCFGNIVVRIGDQYCTPPISCGLLAGTFREQLLNTGKISERVISVAELKAADEIFIVNSVREWRRYFL